MKKVIRKLAIVRLSALGDIVNSAVVLQFIKKNYPDITVEWICEEAFAPILHSAKYLDGVHTVNLKKLKRDKNIQTFQEVLHTLKSLGSYDLVIDMQGLIKSALVSRFLGKNRCGFDKHSIRESLASFFYTQHATIAYEKGVVTRNTHLVASALSLEINDTMLLHKEAVFHTTRSYTFEKGKKNIAFVIGASWKSKIYPKEQVVQVCNTLGENCLIIWGNKEEYDDALWITQHSQHATLAPKMNLQELVNFISSVDLVIGNDTGPTHIAWAQNIPSLTLFGPTNERMIYQTPQNIAIHSPSSVNILKINKNDFSIQEIDPQEVTRKAKELL